MVDSDYITGLYVAIPVYFGMMVLVALWAYRRTKYLEQEEKNDAISAHYLGGRGLGPWVTAGTMFASLFSGYTVIGVPNEAFRNGWTALRWIPTCAGIVVGYAGTGPRLRKCSNVRNHQSPIDFITDRYQSQVLRYTMLVLQVVPSVIYLAAQVIAIKNTFNSMFNVSSTTLTSSEATPIFVANGDFYNSQIDADSNYPVIIIMAAILIFEWAGGLSSVALTDAIQGVIMAISFLAIPIVIKRNFGGWEDLDPETFPRPELYQNLDASQQWLFWNFSMVNISFFTLPHLVQRTYAASDLASLKIGYSVLAIGPWLTLFVSVYMGTVGIQMLEDNPNPTSPFTAIVEEIMSVGGFAKGVGVIAFTASLAAIMSTADSLVIAVSQLISTEVVYPAKPDATPSQIKWIGRIVSLMSMTFALIVGLAWKEGITDLSRIQFGLSFQAIPAFLIALYAKGPRTDCHPWAIATSAWVGMLLVFTLYFGYVKKNDDAKPLDVGVTAGACNFLLLVALELSRRQFSVKKEKDEKEDDPIAESEWKPVWDGRPPWDMPKLHRFGEVPLTPRMVWKLMDGVTEPLTNIWFALFVFLSLTLVTPFVPADIPPFENGEFLFLPAVFNGVPWWAFKIIILSAIPYIAIFALIYHTPNEFPSPSEEEIQQFGVVPEYIELSHNEMVRRASYDEKNVRLYRRRNAVRNSMVQLGITPEKKEKYDPDDKHRRFSALVMGDIGDLDLSEAKEGPVTLSPLGMGDMSNPVAEDEETPDPVE